jgi:hypothetical protein
MVNVYPLVNLDFFLKMVNASNARQVV